MADVLTPEQRRLNMSRIGGRNTAPEMQVRRGLHALGFRYRLHDRRLPGRPDLVFPRHRTAVFVHGCFWHAHGCSMSKMPVTRQKFWQSKLAGNTARDRRAVAAILAGSWRVLVIWDCALRGRMRLGIPEVLKQAASFIRQAKPRSLEITGRIKSSVR